MAGEGESAETLEEADVETETDNDGDAQTSERGAANLTPGNGGTLAGPTKMTEAVAAAGEEVARLTRTKWQGACNCSLVAHTQEAAAQKGMAGEVH